MKITFKQGIARYQTDVNATPTFLQQSTLDGHFLDLIVSPDPTVIIFAHHNATYVYEEVKTVRNAWGPFNDSTTQYLYWDIDLLTAQLTRGFTSFPPVFSGVAPASPANGQHWFDMLNTVMKVWNGVKWVEKIRVFAATYSSSSHIKPAPGFASTANSWLGTQIGITGDFEAGSIVLDAYFKPLRQSDGSFLTSTTNMSVVSLGTKRVRFENEILTLMADEYIPKYSAVQVKAGRRAALARNTDVFTRVTGIASEDMYQGETSLIVSGGLIRNDTWTWAADQINRPLFCGATGQLTTIPPRTGLLQQVGFVYDTDAIYVDIHPCIILDDPFAQVPLPPPGGSSLAPVANFQVVPFVTTATAPATFNFQDVSTNSPTSWEWDFTNDGVVDSTLQNPTFTYVSPGTYTVRMKAINGYGTDVEIKDGYITVEAPAETGPMVNLSLNLGGPMQVMRNQVFAVSVTIKNSGHGTATNISRVITIPDVQGNQVVPSGLPPGSVVTRPTDNPKRTVITLPTILSMIGGGQVASSFSLQAPPVTGAQSIMISGDVSSPEIDSTAGDNNTALYIQVKS